MQENQSACYTLLAAKRLVCFALLCVVGHREKYTYQSYLTILDYEIPLQMSELFEGLESLLWVHQYSTISLVSQILQSNFSQTVTRVVKPLGALVYVWLPPLPYIVSHINNVWHFTAKTFPGKKDTNDLNYSFSAVYNNSTCRYLSAGKVLLLLRCDCFLSLKRQWRH